MASTKTETKEHVDIKYPNRFKVVVYNDDFTPMDFVIQLLIEVFNKPVKEAAAITVAIHQEGKATAGVYSYEVAEQKVHEAGNITRASGHPLKIDLEEA